MSAKLEPERMLGATGIRVPLVGYGTGPLGKKDLSREHAVRCLNHAIDHGVTYLDTSPDYGSEPHIGEVMRTRRSQVFLATKVNNRSKAGVLNELGESLCKLQTDHVDLIQVHAVNAWADLEQALRYSLGLPGVSLAILGMDSTAQIDENVEIAANFKPLEEREEARLIEQVRPLVERDANESKKGESPLFWLHDTAVMGWQQ